MTGDGGVSTQASFSIWSERAPHSACLNCPGYFPNVLLAMVKYVGKLKYMVRKGATESVLESHRCFSNTSLAMEKYPGEFKYMVRGGFTERVLQLSWILFQRIVDVSPHGV